MQDGLGTIIKNLKSGNSGYSFSHVLRSTHNTILNTKHDYIISYTQKKYTPIHFYRIHFKYCIVVASLLCCCTLLKVAARYNTTFKNCRVCAWIFQCYRLLCSRVITHIRKWSDSLDRLFCIVWQLIWRIHRVSSLPFCRVLHFFDRFYSNITL